METKIATQLNGQDSFRKVACRSAVPSHMYHTDPTCISQLLLSILHKCSEIFVYPSLPLTATIECMVALYLDAKLQMQLAQ
jgi:hypothetical protein